ncbi:uncharacterized protein LOC120341904 [Styela clava]
MDDTKISSDRATKIVIESEKRDEKRFSNTLHPNSAALGIPNRLRNGRKLQQTFSCPAPSRPNIETAKTTPGSTRRLDFGIKRHKRCPTDVSKPSDLLGRPSSANSCPNDASYYSNPGTSQHHVTIVETDSKNNSPRIRNYQIKSVKKGVPVIDPKDEAVKKIKLKKKDLRITPYWICQKKKDGIKRNTTAWIFSTFVTFVCVIFPLTSFASDVAFYVTCSDHYNHTAEILEHVRTEHSTKTESKADSILSMKLSKGNENSQNIKTKDETPTSSEGVRPAPLASRWRRSTSQKTNRIKRNSNDQSNKNSSSKKTYYIRPKYRIRHKTFYNFHKIRRGNSVTRPSDAHRNQQDSFYANPNQNIGSQRNSVKGPRQVKGSTVFRQTNFEIEEYNFNETSACDPPSVVLDYMLTDEAVEELEAHRHVTIDIFEPVFILGSFPSLILSILTRLVVLVTGHKNFLSAYVINMACMPLQLITGALSVHSASYHLGKKGFECWHCALDGDCSDMGPLWWLQDGVTKSLLVAIFTKIVDGIAGGLVLFIVIIRLLWPDGGHVTFWWNMLRGLAIFIAFVSCTTVSPLLVITPTMSVMRLEFMELATPFPGRDGLLLAFTIMMSLGLAAWCLSFGVLFIHVSYSMYMYCRERTIDR